MGAISDALRHDLRQPDFSEGYAESFQDAYIATQIKVLREQNEWTQAQLAEQLNTQQTVISRIENANYSAWNISTLRRLARAFRVRLKVSFESYGSLIHDMESFSRESLRRPPREKDPELATAMLAVTQIPKLGNAITAVSEQKTKREVLAFVDYPYSQSAPGSVGQTGAAAQGTVHGQQAA